MIYLGVDPGKQGAFAAIQGETVHLHKMPTTDSEILVTLREVVDQASETPATIRVAMELVNGYVGENQPGSAMFNFGDNNGAVRMALTALGYPPILVRPQEWQKELDIPPRPKSQIVVGVRYPGETKSQWKARLRRVAQELFPWVVVPAWAADALLIAAYLRKKEEGNERQPRRRGISV